MAPSVFKALNTDGRAVKLTDVPHFFAAVSDMDPMVRFVMGKMTGELS